MEDKLKQFFENHYLSPANETSRSFIFNCPSCGGKEKLYIEKETGESVCFKQGSSLCPRNRSKPEYALHTLTKVAIKDVKDFLHQKMYKVEADVVDFNESMKEKKKTEEELPLGNLEINFFPIQTEEARDGIYYLLKRGITLEMMHKYDMMYSPTMRRVIFPVIMNSKLYGWQGRAIDPIHKDFRMHNMPGRWKSLTLMFYDNIVNKDFAILAEGPISALKFEKVGNFVASMGKNTSRTQLDLLRKAGISKLYLAMDRDADDRLEDILLIMRDKSEQPIECYKIEIPSHRDDFGDCTYEECEQAFKAAKIINVDDTFSIGVLE